MVDPLQHVRVNQPIRPVRAETWNAFVDAAIAHRRKRGIGPLGGGGAQNPLNPAATVLVRNNTESNLSAGGRVLAITGVEYSPEDLPAEFRSYPVFGGDTPAADTDAVVILAEPAPADQLARATLAGVAVVDVLINDAGHQWAKPIAGDSLKLTSATSGPARILWKAGSSGVQRCVVNLLDGQGGAADCEAVRECVDDYPETGDATTIDVGTTCLVSGLLTIVDGVLNLDGTPMPGGVDVVIEGRNLIRPMTVPTSWLGSQTCEDAAGDCCDLPIETNCCENPIPATLTVTVVRTPNGNPACPTGDLENFLPWSFPITYDPGTDMWVSEVQNKTVDGCTLSFGFCFQCRFRPGAGNYQWKVGIVAQFEDAGGCTPPADCFDVGSDTCSGGDEVRYWVSDLNPYGEVVCSPFYLRAVAEGQGFVIFGGSSGFEGCERPNYCEVNFVVTE